MSLLFRQEVFAARKQEQLISIRLEPPKPGWSFLGIGVLIVVVVVTLLFCGHYTRHEQATGVLVPTSGLLTSRPLSPGVVTRLFVREGEVVHKGQPLLEVSSLQNSALLGDTQTNIGKQLRRKQSRLQSDYVEQQKQTHRQQQNLTEQLDLLHRQIESVVQQIKLQKDRSQSAQALYLQWLNVGKVGVISKAQLLQQRDTSLQEAINLKELQAKEMQLYQTQTQLRGQLADLPGDTELKQNSTERQLADVMQSMAENAQQQATIFRARASGLVTAILVHPGQSVDAGQSLLTLLPENSPLQAELWVRSEAIGFIKPGVGVAIRYRAYPYQKFGQYHGVIHSLSRSGVSPADTRASIDLKGVGLVYRVEVTLDSQTVSAYGKKQSLRPGMTVDADLLLDRRSLIEWIFEPVYSINPQYAGH